MTKLANCVFLIVFSGNVYAQNQKLTKEVINDFAISYYYKYKYEKNEMLRSCAFLAGQQIGYSVVDVDIAMEKLDVNFEFREELFKIIATIQKGDEEFLTLNFISIGMKTSNAKHLSGYVYAKYIKKPETLNRDSLLKPIKILPTGKPKALMGKKEK